jgi:hypothetical protein
MKDKLLARLMRSPGFQRLSQQDKAIELQNYNYQKHNFSK